MHAEWNSPVKRWVAVVAIAATLLGLSLLLVHVAHCDKPTGDCNICKIVSSVVLPVAVGVLLWFGAVAVLTGIPALGALRRAVNHLAPVRAPPLYS